MTAANTDGILLNFICDARFTNSFDISWADQTSATAHDRNITMIQDGTVDFTLWVASLTGTPGDVILRAVVSAGGGAYTVAGSDTQNVPGGLPASEYSIPGIPVVAGNRFQFDFTSLGTNLNRLTGVLRVVYV